MRVFILCCSLKDQKVCHKGDPFDISYLAFRYSLKISLNKREGLKSLKQSRSKDWSFTKEIQKNHLWNVQLVIEVADKIQESKSEII